MKIYNRHPGIFIAYWNAEDKVDAKGLPVRDENDKLAEYKILGRQQSPDLPAGLAQKLLKEWPHKFTADKAQIDAELEMKRKFEESNQRVADLENHLNKIKALVTLAGDPRNKKAAQAAAGELDDLLANIPGRQPAPAPKAKAIEAPAAEEPPAQTEQESFEATDK